MDNFIEDSIDYLYFNGGFDLKTGDQLFQFRIRPNGEIEVTSIRNHISTTFKGEPGVYQFFAFLIFCDMYSSHQRAMISICKDKNVSRNNLKALNRVYNMYQSMLMMDGKLLAAALSDEEDPGALDRIMLEVATEEVPDKHSKLKFDLIRSRVESYAWYFARKYEYYDNLYQEMITTDSENPLSEYALIRWEELNNNIEAEHLEFFDQSSMIRILYERTKKLEDDLGMNIEGGEIVKSQIISIIQSLANDKVDIMDMIYFIKCAFTSSSMDDRDIVTIGDFLEAIELSYLPDYLKDRICAKLKKINTKENDKIIKFPGV